MTEQYKLPEWLWVIIEKVGSEEMLLGQTDVEADITFIPAFTSSQDAEVCLPLLSKVDGRDYEIQAMRSVEVTKNVAKKGRELFILNGHGTVLEKLVPAK